MSAAVKALATLKDNMQEEPRAATQLPAVKGYRILIKPIGVQEKTAGGIIKPDQLQDLEKSAHVCGFVLTMGEDCYSDKDRFQSNWCEEGDFVLIGAYKGTRFAIHGEEHRIINDDQVLAVVEDPRGYTRA